MFRRMLLILLLAAVACGAGCASRPPGTPALVRPVTPHLVFNPEWAAAPPVFIERSDWPATPYDAGLGEFVDYQIRTIDHQGGLHPHRDYLDRRFYSVRSGQSIR